MHFSLVCGGGRYQRYEDAMPSRGDHPVAFLAGMYIRKQVRPGGKESVNIGQNEPAPVGDIADRWVDLRLDADL